MKRHEEAIAESRRGVALDPVSPLSNNNYAMILWRARRFDEAIEATRHVLDLDPNFINAYWWQGMSYAAKRDFPNAIASLTKGLNLNDGPLFRALLGHVYGRAGDRAKAREALERLTGFARQRFVSPVDFAVVYAGLGDANATFEWLEKAYKARATRIHELPAAYFDEFHSDPRYTPLLKRVGLPV
jgi:tetratricopeptide (TPR) repeat protein